MHSPLGLIALSATLVAASTATRAQLPERLTDSEFWQLTVDLSEPGGTFRSDNLVSNETDLPAIVSELVARGKRNGAYLGVGPEQNFSYISAIRPPIAFIIDIRRDNLRLQLMYKALFELAADRAEFVSRLFTKKRPDGLGVTSMAADLVDGFWQVHTSEEPAFRANLTEILDVLTKRHGFVLSDDDRTGIEHIYYAFYWYGPRITWGAPAWPPNASGPPTGRTWADLLKLIDNSGIERTFLATEEGFRFVKDLQSRNLIVPVVGDFAGPKAIRAVGDYLRRRGANVDVFYASNVEEILQLSGKRMTFCASTATLPVDNRSVFARTGRLLPIEGPFESLSIRYSASQLNSVIVNGKPLPSDQTTAYFSQPFYAVPRIVDALKGCAASR